MKKFVLLQVFDRDIFDPEFYDTLETARYVMFCQTRELLLDYPGMYDTLIGSFYDIPNEWWEAGNIIKSEPEDVVQYEIGDDYCWIDMPKGNYNARIFVEGE